jgi:uncharacterized membrane protein
MKRVLLYLILVSLALGLSAPRVAAKSYHFVHVLVTGEVLRDGSMRVTELRTYAFDGSFSWATYTLNLHGSSGVSEISVADEERPYTRSDSGDPGTFRAEVGGGELRLRWYFHAEDNQRTFKISYRLDNVVTSYRDTAELFWKFIGTGWDVSSDDVAIVVLLPGIPRHEIKAWAHGPLRGVIKIEDGQVRLTVGRLGTHEMIEGRILFPPQAISGGRRVDEDRLAAILKEEGALAVSANRHRTFARLGILSAPLIPLLALAFYLLVFLRYGREHPPAFDGDYYRELPKPYPPAILGVLWRFGEPLTQDFAATIVDLARRGYLVIQEDRPHEDAGDGLVARIIHSLHSTTYSFVRSKKADADLADFERRALSLLFRGAHNGAVSSKTLGTYSSEFRTGYLTWLKQVKTAAAGHGLFEEEGDRMRRRILVAASVLLPAGFVFPFAGALFIGFGAVFAGAGMVIAAFLLFLLSPHLRRRSAEGATEFAQWSAFRRFLTDFSQLKDAPLPSLAIWEQYLPYAVTLGVAQEVLKQIPVVYGEQAVSSPIWYVSHGGGMPSGANFASSLSSFTSSLSSMVSTATSPPSSSSGGGGGFSGGGGGGGGGSGGSAG